MPHETSNTNSVTTPNTPATPRTEAAEAKQRHNFLPTLRAKLSLSSVRVKRQLFIKETDAEQPANPRPAQKDSQYSPYSEYVNFNWTLNVPVSPVYTQCFGDLQPTPPASARLYQAQVDLLLPGMPPPREVNHFFPSSYWQHM